MKFSDSENYKDIIKNKESDKNSLNEEMLKANFLPYYFSTEDKMFSLQDNEQTKNLDENTDNSNIQANNLYVALRKNSFCSTKEVKLPLKPKRLRTAKIKLRTREGHSFLTIKNELLNFVKKKPKTFACVFPFCDKVFSSYYKWQTHHRIHTAEKPFKCEFCEKEFNEKGNLKTHLRIHTGERPYKCMVPCCSSSFYAKGNLTRHIQKHLNEAKKKSLYQTCVEQLSNIK